MQARPQPRPLPAPINDNMIASFKNGICTIKIGPVKYDFTHVLEAKSFIDVYFTRPI